MVSRIQGQRFDKPFSPAGGRDDILLGAKPFRLSEKNFRILTQPHPGALQLAGTCIVLAVGAAIPAFSEWYDRGTVGYGYFWAIGALGVVAIAAPLVGRAVPSERTKLVRQMKEHFRKNPEKPIGGK